MPTALTAKVEVSFATSPDSTSPVWVDISAYVDMKVGIKINHGRGDQFGNVQAGRADFTLNNSDGRFTPGYTAGAYYPNVKLFRRCRISVTDGTTTWVRFDGRVDAWPVQWAPAGKYAEAQITVVDRMKALSNAKPFGNVISAVVMSKSPVVYWPMGDRAGSLQAANAVNTLDPMIVQDDTVTFGSATGPGTDSLTAVNAPTQNNSEGGGWMQATRENSNPFIPNAHDYSIVGWFNVAAPVANDRPIITMTDSRGNDYGLYLADTTGYAAPPDLPTLTNSVITTNFADGATHFFGMTHSNSNGVGTLYIDGLSDACAPGGHSLLGKITSISIFGNPASNYHANAATVAHVAVFDRVLTSTEMSDLKVAGSYAFWGDIAGNRVNRVLGWAGIPTADIVFEYGRSFMDVQTVEGATPVQLIQEVADSEDGVFFISRDGKATFFGRNHIWNQGATFTLGSGQYDTDLMPILDDYGVKNDVEVSSPNAEPARAYDQTSINDIGVYADSIDTVLIADQAAGHARYLVARYKDPMIRWPQVTVDYMTQTTVRSSVLGAELGDVIQLSGLPSQAPSTSMLLVVEGWDEKISLEEQVVSFNTSVAPAWTQNVMVLGDPTYGIVGSNYLAGDK